MKKSTVAVILALLAGTVGIGLSGCASTKEHGELREHVHKYSCPHHPEVVRTTPGECPKCGMKLIHAE